jgi:hypothetical protein
MAITVTLLIGNMTLLKMTNVPDEMLLMQDHSGGTVLYTLQNMQHIWFLSILYFCSILVA